MNILRTTLVMISTASLAAVGSCGGGGGGTPERTVSPSGIDGTGLINTISFGAIQDFGAAEVLWPDALVPPMLLGVAYLVDGDRNSLDVQKERAERIFSELPDVPFRKKVWPKFLRENALRVFGL